MPKLFFGRRSPWTARRTGASDEAHPAKEPTEGVPLGERKRSLDLPRSLQRTAGVTEATSRPGYVD